MLNERSCEKVLRDTNANVSSEAKIPTSKTVKNQIVQLYNGIRQNGILIRNIKCMINNIESSIKGNDIPAIPVNGENEAKNGLCLMGALDECCLEINKTNKDAEIAAKALEEILQVLGM